MWPRPDVTTYSLIVKGLAMCLRVSDALKVVSYVCQLGVSNGEEVCAYSIGYRYISRLQTLMEFTRYFPSVRFMFAIL